jgi:hypothetical protein
MGSGWIGEAKVQIPLSFERLIVIQHIFYEGVAWELGSGFQFSLWGFLAVGRNEEDEATRRTSLVLDEGRRVDE